MKGIEVFDLTRICEDITYVNKESMKVIDEILELVSVIDVADEDTVKSLWLSEDRGTFTEYKKCKLYDKNIKTKKDFLRFFPYDKVWFEFYALENKYAKLVSIHSRPEWYKLFEHCKKGDIDCIIVPSMKTLSTSKN